jgi:hypothetical protein
MTLRHRIQEIKDSLMDLESTDRLVDSSLNFWFSLVTDIFPGLIVGAPTKSEVLDYLEDLEKKYEELNSGTSSDEDEKRICNQIRHDYVEKMPAFISEIDNDSSRTFAEINLNNLIGRLILAHNDLDGIRPDRRSASNHFDYVVKELLPPNWKYTPCEPQNIQIFKSCLQELLSHPYYEEYSLLNFWSSSLGLQLLVALPAIIPYREPLKQDYPELSASVSQATTKKAFKAEFKNEQCLVHFKNHIEEQFKKWKSTEYYTPYFAFIAPSMMGKSRILSEVHRVGIFSFLVCFRQEGMIGIPVRTFRVADLLQTIASGNDEFGAQNIMFLFIVNCAKKLLAWLKTYNLKKKVGDVKRKVASDWHTYQTLVDNNGKSEFWESIANKVETDKLNQKRDKTIDLVALANIYRTELKKILVDIKKILVTKLGFNDDMNACILFEFDEAKALIEAKIEASGHNMFHLMRRAFIIVPDNVADNQSCAPLMAVFTDTTSKVSNFLPSKPWDNSARALTKSTNLMNPFYAIDSFDGFAEPLTTEISTGFFKSLTTEYTKYGRPAFHAISSSDEHEGDIKLKLINVVAAKLLGNKKEIKAVDAVSILGVLVPLNVHPSHELASELVASRMRLCCGINIKRTLVYTMQLPEPVMAIAALKLTNQFGWSEILAGIKQQFGAVTLDIGYKGELGMQIACLIATTKCHKLFGNSSEVKSTLLSDFLQARVGLELFGMTFGSQNVNKHLGLEKPEDDLTERQRKILQKKVDPNFTAIADMYVRVHQFVRFNGTVTSKVLLEYFKRGTAIVCKVNNPGCDLIIPVFSADLGDESDLVESNMTFVAIQVKLRSQPEYGDDYLNNALKHLTKEYCNIFGINESLSYVTLYADLGLHNVKLQKFKATDNKQIAMSYVGYNLRHLKDEKTAIELQNLLEFVHLAHENKEIDEVDQEIVKSVVKITNDWEDA